MAEAKDYIYLCPIIGAVLGIITFLAPVIVWNWGAYGYSIDWYYWIWGYVSVTVSSVYYGSVGDSGITNNNSLLTVSIMCTIIIAAGIATLIIGGIQGKRNTQYDRKFEVLSSIGGILLLVGAITFLLGTDWPTTDEISAITGYGVWDWFEASFGIISPFIGAAIALIGVPAYHYLFTREIEIVPSKAEVREREFPKTEEIAKVKFCPECGQKVEQEGITFCPSCGFKF
ncbi:MAG: zinc ribbon domain-containing protein [Promethearchaeota archaeon]